MEFIKSRSSNKIEYRVYTKCPDIKGDIVYNGHKLGVSNSLLEEITNNWNENSKLQTYFIFNSAVGTTTVSRLLNWRTITWFSFIELSCRLFDFKQHEVE